MYRAESERRIKRFSSHKTDEFWEIYIQKTDRSYISIWEHQTGGITIGSGSLELIMSI